MKTGFPASRRAGRFPESHGFADLQNQGLRFGAKTKAAGISPGRFVVGGQKAR